MTTTDTQPSNTGGCFDESVLERYVHEEIKEIPSDQPDALLMGFRDLAEDAQRALERLRQPNPRGSLMRRYWRDWGRLHDIASAYAQTAFNLGLDMTQWQAVADEFGFEPMPQEAKPLA